MVRLRRSLFWGALCALLLMVGSALYTWRSSPSPNPSGPQTLKPAPRELIVSAGAPGFTISASGQNWMVEANETVTRAYRWEGTGGLGTDLPMLMMRPPGSNGGILVNLRTGDLFEVPDGRVAVASPDLQFLLIKDWVGSVPRSVQELRPNPRAFLLPGGAIWAYWDQSLLYVGTPRGPAVVDPASGVLWQLPEGAIIRSQVAGRVCYEHRPQMGEARAVVCFVPGSPVALFTLLSAPELDPSGGVAWLDADPTGRRLAVAYKRDSSPRLSGVAMATKPSPPPIHLADTVAIYHPEPGRVDRISLPAGWGVGPGRTTGSTWAWSASSPFPARARNRRKFWWWRLAQGRCWAPGRIRYPGCQDPTSHRTSPALNLAGD